MKRKLSVFLALALFAILDSQLTTLFAQGTAFTYQGRLNDGATAASGAYDLTFTLFNASSGGAALGSSNVFNDLTISNGLFTVTLDYGSQFDGNARWLQIAVRPGPSSGAYTNLAPRQLLSPSPYAMLAGTVPDGAITGSKIDSATVQRRVTGAAPGGSFVTGINQDGTVTTGIANDGTITGVTASTGLTGGGSSGSVSLGIANGGVNTTQLADGAVSSAKIDSTTVQRRVTGTAPGGSFLTGINQDGSVTTAVGGGGIWSLNGSIAYYNGGKVGIGTTTPFTRLSVAGTGIYNDPAAAAITLNNTTPTTGHQWEWHALDDGRMQLADVTGAATRVVIDTNGNVGIGTVTPANRLEVAGDTRIDGYVGINTLADDGNGYTMTIKTHSFDGSALVIRDFAGAIIFNVNPFFGGIGPSLRIQGVASKPGGGSWSDSSDQRIKKNVRPLSSALDKLMQLRGVCFEWINPADHADQHGPQGGFIAQEVERTFPHWITPAAAAEHDKALTDDGKIKSLTLPFEFDALVVEAIKEQQQQIKARDTEIEELKKRLDAMEKLINRLSVAKERDGR